MVFPTSLLLGSVHAVRPVFMIVMGIFLLLIAWRICRVTGGWTARLVAAGALLLSFGYGVMMPLYEAGLIGRGADSSLAWQAVKLLVMNAGWLCLGMGLAIHAQIFSPSPPPRKSLPSPLVSREFTA